MSVPYVSSNNQPFGGVILSISNVNYIAQNWGPVKATRTVSRPDQNGDEAAFQLRAEPTTQTGLTLQCETNTTAAPALGTEFAQGNVNYVISGVTEKKDAGAYWTFDIDYRSKTLPTS